MMIKYFMEEYLFQKFQHWMDILYIRFLKFLVVFTIGILPYHCVQAQQDFRCAVRLTFDSDNTGSVANYVLSLQLKNTKGRNVTGASILYKDSQGQVIGNTFLECLNSPEGIKPGSYGDCKVVLQRVDGEFLDTFGTEKWTEIVNTQLSYLNDIQYCDLLGFSY